MKTIFAFAICSLFSVTVATAADVQMSQNELESQESVALEDTFLGCVSSRQACRHEARHHGYHHSYTVRDHHNCPDHHAPLACYGE